MSHDVYGDLQELIGKWRERAPSLATSGYYGNSDAMRAVEACADELESLLQAGRSCPPEGWRAIESAPKDGTSILVHGGIAYWRVADDCDGAWYTLTAESYPGKPIQWPVTCWLPMSYLAPPVVGVVGQQEEHEKTDDQARGRTLR